MKFLPKHEQIELFQQIVRYAAQSDKGDLGSYVNYIFENNKVIDKWNNFANHFTKDEQEIIDVLEKGWKIKILDGERKTPPLKGWGEIELRPN